MKPLKENTKLLSMCSSRNRPEWCTRMIDSFLAGISNGLSAVAGIVELRLLVVAAVIALGVHIIFYVAGQYKKNK